MRAIGGRRLTVVFTSLVVAACGGGASLAPTDAPSPSPAASAAPSEEPSPSPATAREARAAVCEAAVAEGTVVHWNALSDPEAMHGAFMEEYPGITVESVNARPTELVQRALVEAGQGPGADVLVGEPNVVQPLLDENLVNLDIDWPSLGITEDKIHPEINIPRHSRDALGIVYNTTSHSADDMPDTWEEIIDEQWRNQVVVDPRGRPFDQLSLAFGHDETIDYVTRLNELRPLVIQGATAGMLAVAGGQAAIATGGRSAETAEQKALGTPLEIKYLDVLPVNDSYSPVMAAAPHPNAALCFAAWFASEDGQAAYFEAEWKSNAEIPEGAPEGIDILVIETDDQAEQVESIAGEISAIWTGTGG